MATGELGTQVNGSESDTADIQTPDDHPIHANETTHTDDANVEAKNVAAVSHPRFSFKLKEPDRCSQTPPPPPPPSANPLKRQRAAEPFDTEAELKKSNALRVFFSLDYMKDHPEAGKEQVDAAWKAVDEAAKAQYEARSKQAEKDAKTAQSPPVQV